MRKYWYRRILIMIVTFLIAVGGGYYLTEYQQSKLKAEVNASTAQGNMVIPGGMPIGIYMETEGVMVLGTDSITAEDGIRLAETGLVDILSSTLSGLNPDKTRSKPDYEMIREMKAKTSLPVNAEGGIWEVAQYEKCLEAGADMVTIGTAITRPHLITERFADCQRKWNEAHS